jgi:hypothetical protein
MKVPCPGSSNAGQPLLLLLLLAAKWGTTQPRRQTKHLLLLLLLLVLLQLVHCCPSMLCTVPDSCPIILRCTGTYSLLHCTDCVWCTVLSCISCLFCCAHSNHTHCCLLIHLSTTYFTCPCCCCCCCCCCCTWQQQLGPQRRHATNIIRQHLTICSRYNRTQAAISSHHCCLQLKFHQILQRCCTTVA